MRDDKTLHKDGIDFACFSPDGAMALLWCAPQRRPRLPADAGTLRAQSEQFFKNEIFKLCRLWGDRLEEALEKIEEIRFAADAADWTEEVSALFRSPEKPEFLVFGDALFAARLEEAAPGMTVHCTRAQEEAFALLSKNDIRFVLIEPAGAPGATRPPSSSSRRPNGSRSVPQGCPSQTSNR